jgi:hypothetical protein
MKYIKKIFENLENPILNKIIDYITTHANIALYQYGGDIIVERDGNKYNSKLYLTTFGKAIRFNFNKNQLVSVDVWKVYSFNSIKADYTMEFHTNSIVRIINDIYLFFTNNITAIKEDYDKKNEYDIHVGKQEKNTFLPPSKFEVKKLDMVKAAEYNKKIYNDDKLDIFKAIEYSVMQVAHNMSKFFLITGGGGFGKTTTVETVLEEIGKKYYSASGSITEAALYEILFKNRKKTNLLLLDDCDTYWGDENMINLLKAATDTKKIRRVSKLAKTYFDSFDMTDDEIEQKYKSSGKLPNSFIYEGSIICITNTDSDELAADKDTEPFLTRGLHIDVKLTKIEAINKIRSVMNNMTDINIKIKEEALEYLIFLTTNYKTKIGLNIRSYIHTLNTRISNNFPIVINGEKQQVWKLLVKEYLIKK